MSGLLSRCSPGIGPVIWMLWVALDVGSFAVSGQNGKPGQAEYHFSKMPGVRSAFDFGMLTDLETSGIECKLKYRSSLVLPM